MRRVIAILLCASLAACGTMQNYRALDQATEQELTASVGGTIFRVLIAHRIFQTPLVRPIFLAASWIVATPN
jgi:hypothetical protein